MKTLVITFALLASSLIGQTQSLKIVNHLNGNLDLTNSTFTRVFDNAPGADHYVYLKIENTTNDSLDVYVKRYETSVDPLTKNYFCWKVCYGTNFAGVKPQLPDPVPASHFNMIEPQSLSLQQLEAHHLPEGNTGVNCYRYVAYVGSNPNDSVYVDICFDIGFTGVDDISAEMQISPNPSHGSINIELAGNLKDGKIEIMDITGKTVQTHKVNIGVNQIDLNLSTGAYFCRLSDGSNIIKTEKLIIE